MTVPTERADRLAVAVAEEGLDSLLIGDLVRPGDSSREAMADLIWLTGFRGTSGLALLGSEVRSFITDFRYIERAGVDLDGFDVHRAEDRLVPELGGMLSGRVGFDETKTSVRTLRKLEESVAADGVELVAVKGLVEALRRTKDAVEIEAIAEAARLTDAVYAELEQQGLAGRSEREVALSITSCMRELGADGPSFPPIVGSGPNGALPHSDPSDRVIGAGEPVVIDMGAIVDGYCSDATRTLVDGELGGEEAEVYDLVLRAQLAALDAVRAGVSGVAADAVAREIIDEAGQGDNFGHGLGHGIGIEVHEAPRLSPRSEDTLQVGDLVTVEPGVYLPGRFGVRIEDLVVVESEGCRNLNAHPKERRG